jgi:hypothetical protein
LCKERHFDPFHQYLGRTSGVIRSKGEQNMKKILVTLVVVMLTLAIVIPAAAGNGQGTGGPGKGNGTSVGSGAGVCEGTGAGACVGSESGAVTRNSNQNQASLGAGMSNSYGEGVRNGNQNQLGIGAQMGQQGSRKTFALVGTIAAIGTDSVTINVLAGNKLAQPAIGTEIAVTVSLQTWYVLRDGTTYTLIDFADLEVGQSVSVNGTLDNSTWLASRITVGAPLTCLQ